LTPIDFALLLAIAFATSILSAVAGLAGGIVLLTVMLLYFEPLVAIPLHGVVQLASNSSRAVIQRAHIDWRLVWRYAVPLLPVGALGLQVAQQLPAAGLRLAIGLFVLVATWARGLLLLGRHPERMRPTRRFWILGGVLGFLNMNIGATGPLLAPFFLNLQLGRQGIVGTMAACQTLGHLAKIAIFGLAGFGFRDYAGLLAGMCAMVLLGTWLGSRLLDRLNERVFRRIFQAILTLIALRLVIVDGARLLGLGA
jgi:uncharacterized membrane protein YfcA